ncbi:hypothetical protein AC249_AIPGENE17950 [Exaiptasia diaphana]|nr:hypothetical protein AC249_AIPGENE17950 [Exaiptasia diaphana]
MVIVLSSSVIDTQDRHLDLTTPAKRGKDNPNPAIKRSLDFNLHTQLPQKKLECIPNKELQQVIFLSS